MGKLARLRRPSLRWRMLLWALTLAVVPMALSGIGLNRFAHDALVDRHDASAENLVHTAAGAMTSRLARGEDQVTAADTVARLLESDRRLAFVLVYDARGRALFQQITDAQAWHHYRVALDVPRTRPVNLADHRPQRLDNGTIAVQGASFLADGGEGHVVLALRDPTLLVAARRLDAVQLAALAVTVAVALPAIFLAVRQWTGPLRELVRATRDLAARRYPRPVPVTTRDEVGQLAEQFNAMVRSLAESHRQLEQANADLERKVKARTAELNAANGRLAEEIRNKNEFLRAVSHDLNAPVRNILGLAGILLRKHGDRLDAETRTKLERIRSNAHTQTSMIDELLELSRIRTRPGEPEPVDLNALVRELQASLAYDLERTEVALEVEDPLPTLYVEPNRVRQVFQNLFENAIKYMLDAPERRITVHAVPRADGYAFCVRDTGIGIAPTDLERVFQPFQRGQQTEPSRVAGRGVGLASVRSIVESWGGRAWVESQPGAGSSFHFTIAWAHVAAPADRAAQAG